MLSRIQSFFDQHIETVEDSNPEQALQIATAALLIEISRADAEVAESEQAAIIKAVQEVFGLDQDETQALLRLAEDEVDEAVSLSEFTQLLNSHFSATQKTHLVELLWEVAFADRRVDQYEDYYIRKITDLLYVSHNDFIRMKHRVMSRTEPGKP